ncbi:hypothetical protein [Paraburkholderia dilworthii]|uniref:Uncharacterized protein n=1 Tax=Paraburkholderia dilworthii TaxID=948106 RepID=A0ABW9CZ42_9BURK
MKRPPLAEWLFRFASSQKNVDRVAIWLGGTVSFITAILAIVVSIALVLKWSAGY